MVIIALAFSLASAGFSAELSSAQKDYRDLEYEAAQQKLEELYASGKLSGADLATLHVWRAMVMLQLGQTAPAETAMRFAVKANASVVTPADAPPIIVQRMNELRRAAAREIEIKEDAARKEAMEKEAARLERLRKEAAQQKAQKPAPAQKGNGLFVVGASTAGVGAVMALAAGAGIYFVDDELGKPAPAAERQTLAQVGLGLVATAALGTLALVGGGVLMLLPGE